MDGTRVEAAITNPWRSGIDPADEGRPPFDLEALAPGMSLTLWQGGESGADIANPQDASTVLGAVSCTWHLTSVEDAIAAINKSTTRLLVIATWPAICATMVLGDMMRFRRHLKWGARYHLKSTAVLAAECTLINAFCAELLARVAPSEQSAFAAYATRRST